MKQNVSSINHDFISVSSIALCKSEESKDTVEEYVTIENNLDLTKEFTRVEIEETSTLDDPKYVMSLSFSHKINFLFY